MDNKGRKRKFWKEESSEKDLFIPKQGCLDDQSEEHSTIETPMDSTKPDSKEEYLKKSSEKDLFIPKQGCLDDQSEEHSTIETPMDSTKPDSNEEYLEIHDLLLECCVKVCNTMEDKQVSDTNINILPEEILIMIFRYLHYPDFCRSKRVCRRWYEIATNNVFFKRESIDIRRQKHGPKIPEIFYKQLATLSACITHLYLDFDRKALYLVKFHEFTREIQRRLPNLHTLFLHRISFDVCGLNLDIAVLMPKYTTVLVLHNCIFQTVSTLSDFNCYIPKIQVLDLSYCRGMYISPFKFNLFPYLKKLRLAGFNIEYRYLREHLFKNHEPNTDPTKEQTEVYPDDFYFSSIIKVSGGKLESLDLEFTMICSHSFKMICRHCYHLTELFICFTSITDKDLTFDSPKTVLPNLKTLCLRNCKVTVKGISSFLRVCPSLECVYVGTKDEDPADSFFQCDLPKVCVLNGYKHCNHYEKINYMNE